MAGHRGVRDRAGRSRRIAFLLAAAVLALTCAGCWDLEEPDALALVLALGLDTAGRGEVEVTFQVSIPRNLPTGPAGGGGGPAGGPPVEVVSVRARNVSHALQRLQYTASRRPTLIQNQVLVIGEALARQGLASHLGELQRLPEFRGNVLLVVARGRASSLLTIEPLLEPRPSRFLESLLRQGHVGSQGPLVRAADFLAALESPARDPVAALMERVERGTLVHATQILVGSPSKARLAGAAVFRGDTLVSELDPGETRTFLLGVGQWRDGTVTVPDPRDPASPLSLLVHSARPSVRARRPPSGPVEIRLLVRVEAELHAAEAPGTGAVGPRQLEEIARGLEELFAGELRQLVRRSQEEFRADVFGFGQRVRGTFATLPDWEAFDWSAQFPRARVEVAVRVAIRRRGLTLEPPVPR